MKNPHIVQQRRNVEVGVVFRGGSRKRDPDTYHFRMSQPQNLASVEFGKRLPPGSRYPMTYWQTASQPRLPKPKLTSAKKTTTRTPKSPKSYNCALASRLLSCSRRALVGERRLDSWRRLGVLLEAKQECDCLNPKNVQNKHLLVAFIKQLFELLLGEQVVTNNITLPNLYPCMYFTYLHPHSLLQPLGTITPFHRKHADACKIISCSAESCKLTPTHEVTLNPKA